jgi:N-acetylmuramic acid 6-phosphate etherase
MNTELHRIPTEARNPFTRDIDVLPTLEALRRINAEDARVPVAVAQVLPDLALAVDNAVARLRRGGRMHYFGAGTSGRIAVIDAAELPPTFGIDPSVVVAHHAGGMRALWQSVENVEDDPELGSRDAAAVGPADVAVGIAASGRTPYVVGALRTAASHGAFTVLVSSNPTAAFGAEVDVHIAVDTGPEVVTGSTRMKAGTAAKLVLNALSTTVMVGLGHTYSNLMVNVTAMNAKLRARLVRILAEATGAEADTCAAALAAADGDARVALVALVSDVTSAEALATLDEAGGVVRDALRMIDRVRRRTA